MTRDGETSNQLATERNELSGDERSISHKYIHMGIKIPKNHYVEVVIIQHHPTHQNVHLRRCSHQHRVQL